MRARRDWQLTPAAADRFVADLEAAARNGDLQRRLAELRSRKLHEAAVRARLGIPEVAA